MYLETTVKKPRKRYQCDLCLCGIIGHHTKVVQVYNEDFHSERVHDECLEKMKQWCGACDNHDYCETSPAECFAEKSKGAYNVV